ncbi:MAG TPA: tetratricopeptide repeat protein [Elusimicrobiales bacterium]|nr:tetratricopeptide repeat protein [Elusimicrobiales bacterium]
MTPAPPSAKSRLSALTPLLIPVIAFAVFLPALKNGFLDWDDISNLVENRNYMGLGRAQLKWMFTTFHLGPYQPLSWLTYAADYLAWGLNPFGFHLTNVLLHCANALLFYFLCAKLLALGAAAPGREDYAELNLAAGFAALFFAIHPLRVESVAWVTERRDVLCGFFYLAALLLYIAPRSPGAAEKPFWRRHLLPLAAFLLALLSKGMAVTLPAALLVLDIYPLRRLPGDPRRWLAPENRRVWAEKIPFFALAALFGAVGYAGQAHGITSYRQSGLGQRAAQVLFGTFFYVRKTLLPLELSPLYKLPAGFGLLAPQAFFAGAALAAITAAAVALRRRIPAGLAAWACFLAALAPVSGIVKFGVQAAADRYSYLPCLGFAALAGAGFLACRRAAAGRFKKACLAGACLLLAALGSLTWRQQGVWRDSETLWKHALALDPELDYAYNNLGNALKKRGQQELALSYYSKAVSLNPENVPALNNIGVILAAQRKFEPAIASYLKALALNPRYAEAHNNLGSALDDLGRPAEAAPHYQEALRLNPGFAEAHNNLAGILAAQGRTAEAAEHCLAALKADPGLAEAHNNLAGLLAVQGRTPEAEAHYRAAITAKPDFAAARGSLGDLLAARGELEEAALQYREALKTGPASAAVHNNLGGVLTRQGRPAAAIQEYLRALELNPGLAEAHYSLSFVLAGLGRRAEAEKHYRQALRLKPGLAAPRR